MGIRPLKLAVTRGRKLCFWPSLNVAAMRRMLTVWALQTSTAPRQRQCSTPLRYYSAFGRVDDDQLLLGPNDFNEPYADWSLPMSQHWRLSPVLPDAHDVALFHLDHYSLDAYLLYLPYVDKCL